VRSWQLASLVYHTTSGRTIRNLSNKVATLHELQHLKSKKPSQQSWVWQWTLTSAWLWSVVTGKSDLTFEATIQVVDDFCYISELHIKHGELQQRRQDMSQQSILYYGTCICKVIQNIEEQENPPLVRPEELTVKWCSAESVWLQLIPTLLVRTSCKSSWAVSADGMC